MDLSQFNDPAKVYSNAEKVVFGAETATVIRAVANDGAMRRIAAGKKTDFHGLGNPEDEKIRQIRRVGTFGEFAVSKYLGLFHDMAPPRKGPDIAGIIGVRTAIGHHKSLILRPDDDPGLPYVLATHVDGEDFVLLHGWAVGRDVMIPAHLKSVADRPPAWFVPKSELSLMCDLFNFLPENTWRCCHNAKFPF
jgi:hypothetical protein